MICEACSEKFSNRIVIDGKSKTLHKRKYCLECSPYGKHNTKKLNLTDNPLEKDCPRCKKTLPSSLFYTKRSGRLLSYCKSCVSEQTLERTRELKRQAVEYKGGQCQICSYKKSMSGLTFHHRDPSKKDFNVSEKRAVLLDKIKPELDKCDLLCRNCHAELHEKLSSTKFGIPAWT